MVAFRLRAQNAPPVLVPAVSRGAGRSGTAFRLRATTDRHQSQCANGGIECYPRLLGPLPGLSCRFTTDDQTEGGWLAADHLENAAEHGVRLGLRLSV